MKPFHRSTSRLHNNSRLPCVESEMKKKSEKEKECERVSERERAKRQNT